uniref:Uncharacterized protein n=1 Tax=Candidatus Kentrum sp. DK TaxID=2126562 RepID=A0A450SCC5_9GAMM|nr:MAG: hypothetical protein BECKDK2373B_GA0170837_102646 [Candidatus Kentron sp. DK]
MGNNRLLQRLDSALFGSVIALHRANRIVQKKIDECKESEFEDDDRLRHTIEDLHATLNLSIQRIERIENKAMNTLLGVAVAITVFGATSGLLGANGIIADSSSPFRIIAAALLAIAVLYLFGSGLLALQTYEIGQIYRPTLTQRAPVVEEKHEKTATLYAIEQNQRVGTLRSNRLSASFSCLRNGLITVVLLVIVVGVGASGVDFLNTFLRA